MSGSHDHQELYVRGTKAPAQPLVMGGLVLAVIGLAIFVMQVLGSDPGRGWRIFHVNFLFFTGAAMGGIIFAAIQKVTKGKWAGPIVRFAEAGVAFLPVSLVCFLVLFLGRDYLFPWIAEPTPARGAWLTLGFVFWRDLIALLILFGVAAAFVIHDLKPDVAALMPHVDGKVKRMYQHIARGFSGSDAEMAANDETIGWMSPLLILLYAWLMSLIGFDLIQSLAPWWVSNLFGAFFFIGAFLTGMTTLGLMMLFWRSRMKLHDIIGRQQFHDLGKLIFGFSIFWAYLTYSQLLVIWYGNLPEETSFIFFRLSGAWRPVALAVGAMVFLIPFWGLIWVKAKITPATFGLFLVISFVGVWLERYLLVQPNYLLDGPVFGLPEIGVSLGFLGLFILSFGMFAKYFPMISPRLAQRALELHH